MRYKIYIIIFWLIVGKLYAIGEIDIPLLGTFTLDPMNLGEIIKDINNYISEENNMFSGDYKYITEQPAVGISTGFRYQWNSLLLRADVGLLNTIKKAAGNVQVTGKEKNNINISLLGFFFFNTFGYSIYIKGRDKIYVFGGPAGIYTYVKMSVDSEKYEIVVFDSKVNESYTYEASAFGFVFGVGGEIEIGKRVSLAFDWVSYRSLATRIELPSKGYTAFPLVGSMFFWGIIYHVPI